MDSSNDKSLVRLNKFLSQAGVCSRRSADRLIEIGVVQLNGKVVTEVGTKINPQEDIIKVRGKAIHVQDYIYVMFHKPKSVVTTMNDPQDRRTVADYLESLPTKVFPVGRLDWNSEGLLLFTNDGDFANQVMHPKNDIPKTYEVKIEGSPDPEKLKKLLLGVTIVGGKVRARSLEKLRRSDTKHTWYRITITQGVNRQIRQMFSKLGYDVLKLQRVAIGSLMLGNLEKGDYRLLTREQVAKVFDDPDKTTQKTRQKSFKRITKSTKKS